MKNKLVILILVFFSFVATAQQNEKVFTCHIKEIPFKDFCDLIFKQTTVKVFYQEKWVKSVKVTLDSVSITPFNAVSFALLGTGLQVSNWHSNLVVLPSEKLLSNLPDYSNVKKKNLNPDSAQKVITESEERYISGRKADITKVLQIGRKGATISGNRAKILGRILDQETGEPLFGATLYVVETKTGAASDINGFVSLTLSPGTYNVLFEYLGYEKEKYEFQLLSDGNFTIKMQQAVIQMKEVIVYGDRQMNIRAKDPGLDKMSIKTLRELPMMMGERDILKVSVTLPGIVSVGEGSSGINVRGGGSDQNAFYINKIPIYNTSHLFGFFPAFNADIIKDFSIYKGHIPAQYGGHLSSVFNIITRQGNRKHFTARGGISPITGNLVVEGPLKKDTSSFIISARSSYSDWILKKIKNNDIRNSSAGFNDFSIGMHYDIKKTQVSVFGYHSFDRFALSDFSSYNYSNNGLSATMSSNFSNSFKGEFTLVGSEYNFSSIEKLEASNAYEHAYKMMHYEFRADFKHMINENNSLNYGIGTVLYRLDRGTVLPYGEASFRKKIELGSETGLESAIFLTEVSDILPWLNISTGIRYAIFNPLGPKMVYQYDPDRAIAIENINDSIKFNSNQPIKWYHEPDLRIAINIKTDEKGSVKLAFTQMHQNLFMLNTTAAISPNTQWKLADYHLLPSKSSQLSAGVFRSLTEYGLETSAEIFYKQTKNFPEFKDGADFLTNPLVETSVLQGNQVAYGIEFFIKRSMQKIDGWLSYTYSRSKITVDGDNEWNQINGGETYPANFDIPHSLNLVLNYHLSRRIILASIFTYQTGKPVTYPVSIYYVNGLQVVDYSKRNAYRIPDYLRADFSLTFEGSLKKNKPVHSSLIMSVYNATGRDNAYSVYYKTEDGLLRSYKYSVISVPIFTITWLFKLGNYASE